MWLWTVEGPGSVVTGPVLALGGLAWSRTANTPQRFGARLRLAGDSSQW